MKLRKIKRSELRRHNIKDVRPIDWERGIRKVLEHFGSEVEIAGVKYDLIKALLATDEARYYEISRAVEQEKLKSGEWVELFDEFYKREDLAKALNLRSDEFLCEEDEDY